MKKAMQNFLMIGLVLLLLFCSAAFAQEESPTRYESRLQLFTAGEIPFTMRARSTTESDFVSYVADQLRNQAESIYVLNYAMPLEQFKLALNDAINESPDLFYIGSHFSYTVGSTSGNIYRFFPEYLYSGEDLQARIASFNQSVNEIADLARAASGHPIGQMMAVNDYFCVQYEYDHRESNPNHRPDLLFTSGTGVCQAYMLAYAAVLDELGIPNTHATSYAMNHTWNLIQLDDNWYHTDVTWNDPKGPELLSRYRYFLLSDSGMLNNQHYSWTAKYTAADTAYDHFFWRETYTPMGISGEKVFYLNDDFTDGTRTICAWNMNDGAAAALHRFSIADANGSYYTTTSYNPLCADDTYIYYAARENLYRILQDGSQPNLIYSGGSQDLIWSCWTDGSNIYMMTGDASLENTEVIALPILNNRLILPASTVEIRAEAFLGTTAQRITLPDGLQIIGERAFAGSASLSLVDIPASVKQIADNAFEGSENVSLVIIPGSYAETYALQHGIHYIAMPE